MTHSVFWAPHTFRCVYVRCETRVGLPVEINFQQTPVIIPVQLEPAVLPGYTILPLKPINESSLGLAPCTLSTA